MLFQSYRRIVAAWLAVAMLASPVMADCGQIIIYSRVQHIPPSVVYYPPPIWEGFPTNNTGHVNVNVNVNNNNLNENSNNNIVKTYPNPQYPTNPGRPNPPGNRPPTGNVPGAPPTRPPVTKAPPRPPGSRPPAPGNPNRGGKNNWVTSVTSRGESFTEPNQYAVVAWNGTEEILWISTKQKSLVPGEGAALSIMPMPGKPISVTRGDDKLYQTCYDAVDAKLAAANGGVASRAPLLEVQIGAHNIFVLEGKSVENLEEQIQDFISKRFGGEAEGMIGDNTRAVIADYLSRDFQYFAFDLINSNEEEEIKVPIQYRFESDYCYYPMVVSKIGGTGETEVNIVAFTPGELKQHAPTALTFEEVTKEESVEFTSDELQTLSPDIQALFGDGGAVAREWSITGDMKSFKGDIAWR